MIEISYPKSVLLEIIIPGLDAEPSLIFLSSEQFRLLAIYSKCNDLLR